MFSRIPYLFCLLVLLSESSEAALPWLAREYVQNNAGLKESRNRIHSAEQDIALLEAGKTWRLGYTPVYRSDGLQTLSPFAPTRSETTEHVFSLSKDFEWGGKLTMGKRLSRFQQDRNISIFGSNLDTHSFTHEIRYQQNLGSDFFGRLFAGEKAISEERHQLAEEEYQQRLQKGLLELARSYAGARLQRSLVRLQREARKRAEVVKTFVRNRVKDGLREKVDLYRARSNVHLQKEQVNSALQNLEASLQDISATLHRKVTPKEIKYYNTQGKIIIPGTDPTRDNADIRMLAHRQHILDRQLLKVGHEFLPRIGLNLGYKTNAVNEKQTQSWKDGHFFASDHSSKEVSLVLNWAIGNAPQKALRSKLRASKATLDAQKNLMARTLLLQSEGIKKRIARLEEIIRSSRSREKLASKIVDEMNKLYRKGKSNLDLVIRAEEDLIRVQTGFVRHLAQRDMLFYALLHLHGSLDNHLLNKRGNP